MASGRDSDEETVIFNFRGAKQVGTCHVPSLPPGIGAHSMAVDPRATSNHTTFAVLRQQLPSSLYQYNQPPPALQSVIQHLSMPSSSKNFQQQSIYSAAGVPQRAQTVSTPQNYKNSHLTQSMKYTPPAGPQSVQHCYQLNSVKASQCCQVCPLPNLTSVPKKPPFTSPTPICQSDVSARLPQKTTNQIYNHSPPGYRDTHHHKEVLQGLSRKVSDYKDLPRDNGPDRGDRHELERGGRRRGLRNADRHIEEKKSTSRYESPPSYSHHSRQKSEIAFRGFKTRYSDHKLLKHVLFPTRGGLLTFLKLNSQYILKTGWQKEITPRQRVDDKTISPHDNSTKLVSNELQSQLCDISTAGKITETDENHGVPSCGLPVVPSVQQVKGILNSLVQKQNTDKNSDSELGSHISCDWESDRAEAECINYQSAMYISSDSERAEASSKFFEVSPDSEALMTNGFSKSRPMPVPHFTEPGPSMSSSLTQTTEPANTDQLYGYERWQSSSSSSSGEISASDSDSNDEKRHRKPSPSYSVGSLLSMLKERKEQLSNKKEEVPKPSSSGVPASNETIEQNFDFQILQRRKSAASDEDSNGMKSSLAKQITSRYESPKFAKVKISRPKPVGAPRKNLYNQLALDSKGVTNEIQTQSKSSKQKGSTAQNISKSVQRSNSTPEKTAHKTAETRKATEKNAETRKVETKKAELQETATKKTDALKNSAKKLEAPKSPAKKIKALKSPTKKTEAQESLVKKTEVQESPIKKTEVQKSMAKKTEAQESPAKKTEGQTTPVNKTQPQTTSPSKTQLQTTSPNKTQPQTTSPNKTQPQTTSPNKTQPQTTSPNKTQPQTTSPSKIQPQTTSPNKTQPQTTSPNKTQPQTTSASKTQLQTTSSDKTQPQTTSPNKTQPQTTSFNKTQPQTTSPNKTQPQTTSPNKTQPQTTSFNKTQPQTTSFNKTQPQTTSPNKTQPQTTPFNKTQSQTTSPRKTQPQTTSFNKTQPQTTSFNKTQPQTSSFNKTQPQTISPNKTQPQTTSPNKTQPQTTSPNKTQPQTTSPSKTQPQTTSPNKTQPQTISPNKTQPQTTSHNKTQPQTISPNKTQPQTTSPNKTQPQTTSPNITQPQTTSPNITQPQTTSHNKAQPQTTPPKKTQAQTSSTNITQSQTNPNSNVQVQKTAARSPEVNVIDHKQIEQQSKEAADREEGKKKDKSVNVVVEKVTESGRLSEIEMEVEDSDVSRKEKKSHRKRKKKHKREHEGKSKKSKKQEIADDDNREIATSGVSNDSDFGNDKEKESSYISDSSKTDGRSSVNMKNCENITKDLTSEDERHNNGQSCSMKHLAEQHKNNAKLPCSSQKDAREHKNSVNGPVRDENSVHSKESGKSGSRHRMSKGNDSSRKRRRTENNNLEEFGSSKGLHSPSSTENDSPREKMQTENNLQEPSNQRGLFSLGCMSQRVVQSKAESPAPEQLIIKQELRDDDDNHARQHDPRTWLIPTQNSSPSDQLLIPKEEPLLQPSSLSMDISTWGSPAHSLNTPPLNLVQANPCDHAEPLCQMVSSSPEHAKPNKNPLITDFINSSHIEESELTGHCQKEEITILHDPLLPESSELIKTETFQAEEYNSLPSTGKKRKVEPRIKKEKEEELKLYTRRFLGDDHGSENLYNDLLKKLLTLKLDIWNEGDSVEYNWEVNLRWLMMHILKETDFWTFSRNVDNYMTYYPSLDLFFNYLTS